MAARRRVAALEHELDRLFPPPTPPEGSAGPPGSLQGLETLGRLVSGVAHDFNNILVGLLANAEMILEDRAELPPAVTEAAEEIRDGSRRASELVRQVLSVARDGRARTEELELDGWLASSFAFLERLAGPDARVEHHPGAASAAVALEPGQLLQVVLNLVVNAREAMPAGGVIRLRTAVERVGPSTETSALAGGFVRLDVEDEGIGMDPDLQAELFRPFFTTKRNGTGLGLTTVQTIMQRCGGTIRIRSEPLRGTKVSLYFPRVKASSSD